MKKIFLTLLFSASLFCNSFHINNLKDSDIATQLNNVQNLSKYKKNSQLSFYLIAGGISSACLYLWLNGPSGSVAKEASNVVANKSEGFISGSFNVIKESVKATITTIPSAFLQILLNPFINHMSNKVFGDINLDWFLNRSKFKSNIEDIKMVVKDLDRFAQDPYLKDVFENYRCSLNISVDLYVKNMSLLIAVILFNKPSYPNFENDIAKIIFNIKELSNKLVDLVNESLDKNNFEGVSKNIEAILGLVEKNINYYGYLENTL